MTGASGGVLHTSDQETKQDGESLHQPQDFEHIRLPRPLEVVRGEKCVISSEEQNANRW